MQWFGDSYSDIIVFDKATIYTWLGVYSSIFRVIQLLIAFQSKFLSLLFLQELLGTVKDGIIKKNRKLVLEKAEEPEIKLPTSAGSWKKQESSRKASISALLTMPKPLTVCITINCGKFFKRWEYQITWSASWEICMQVRKQQLELDMEQQTGSK